MKVAEIFTYYIAISNLIIKNAKFKRYIFSLSNDFTGYYLPFLFHLLLYQPIVNVSFQIKICQVSSKFI